MSPLTVFYDGKCPLCSREVAWIRGRDRAGSIRFIDIAGAGFRAETYGFTYPELMDEIRALDAEGRRLSGVEVFRRMYETLGWAVAVRISRWPLVSQALDLVYRIWAKNRLRLTGRCEDEVCAVPTHSP